MVRVKICGLTNLADARLASDLGAHALGFIFYPKSPRYIAPEAARDIIAQLPPLVLSIGVFVNEELATVRKLSDQIGLDWVQLHGEEPPDYCQALGRNVIKVIPVKDATSLDLMTAYQGRVRAFLLDTYKSGQKGGTGQTFDWSLAVQAKTRGPVILAGGLTPENVAAAVQAVHPTAVDVASGVEAAPGRKDPNKLRAFFKALNCKCKENL
ncbi:MAG: phosphoribosylanthranilate isomerase [Desulfobacca sp.]|nr:phosphoribosylanthranilate isomerase [Desulfobacca sp.]